MNEELDLSTNTENLTASGHGTNANQISKDTNGNISAALENPDEPKTLGGLIDIINKKILGVVFIKIKSEFRRNYYKECRLTLGCFWTDYSNHTVVDQKIFQNLPHANLNSTRFTKLLTLLSFEELQEITARYLGQKVDGHIHGQYKRGSICPLDIARSRSSAEAVNDLTETRSNGAGETENAIQLPALEGNTPILEEFEIKFGTNDGVHASIQGIIADHEKRKRFIHLLYRLADEQGRIGKGRSWESKLAAAINTDGGSRLASLTKKVKSMYHESVSEENTFSMTYMSKIIDILQNRKPIIQEFISEEGFERPEGWNRNSLEEISLGNASDEKLLQGIEEMCNNFEGRKNVIYYLYQLCHQSGLFIGARSNSSAYGRLSKVLTFNEGSVGHNARLLERIYNNSGHEKISFFRKNLSKVSWILREWEESKERGKKIDQFEATIEGLDLGTSSEYDLYYCILANYHNLGWRQSFFDFLYQQISGETSTKDSNQIAVVITRRLGANSTSLKETLEHNYRKERGAPRTFFLTYISDLYEIITPENFANSNGVGYGQELCHRGREIFDSMHIGDSNQLVDEVSKLELVQQRELFNYWAYSLLKINNEERIKTPAGILSDYFQNNARSVESTRTSFRNLLAWNINDASKLKISSFDAIVEASKKMQKLAEIALEYKVASESGLTVSSEQINATKDVSIPTSTDIANNSGKTSDQEPNMDENPVVYFARLKQAGIEKLEKKD